MNYNLLLFIFIVFLTGTSCERFESEKTVATKKKSYREIITNAAGDSAYLFYNSEGNLQSKATYKNGLKNGVAYNYYSDGTVQNELHYQNDIKHGLVSWYYESGQLYRETIYKGGVKDGIQKVYYENGAIKAEIPYVNNEVVVGTKEYKKSGTLIDEYPKIVISPINKLKEESTYYLRFRLDPEKKRVKFFLLEDHGYGEKQVHLDHHTKNGITTLPVAMYPGQTFNRTFKIGAIFKTRRGNPMVLQRTYNLNVKNNN